MVQDGYLESTARELFDEEWRHEQEQRDQDRLALGDATALNLCVCPPTWLLPGLIALIAESHNEPVERLRPAIRRLILEQNFVDANGDGLINVNEDARVDRLVEVMVRVLEKVRKLAIEQGRWSDMPITPLMCG